MPGSSDERALLPELVEYVFAQLPLVLYATVGLSVLVVVVFWGLVPAWLLLAWLAAVNLVTLLRFLLYIGYMRGPDRPGPPERWRRRYASGALVAGVLWGATPLFFYSDSSPQTNVFLAFVLGGLISGAATSMAPLRGTMRAFTAMLCLPISTVLLLHGDNLHLVMGTMLLIYGASYAAISANTARMIETTLTLRHANLREIDERRRAEEELRAMKEDLEVTVAQRTRELEAANQLLVREVDERRMVEDRLRISEQRYRSLVESCSDWIWEIDEDGTYTYSSPSVRDLLGYTPDEVVGRKFYDFMSREEAERTLSLFRSSASRGKPFYQLVNRCIHRDGGERILETNGEPIFDETGAFRGYRGIDRDITLRVIHEEQSRKVEHLRSLGLLADGIAHDFNNLLTTIFSNIDLARLGVDPDSDVGRTLADTATSIEKARTLTNRLLTFSRGGSPIRAATPVHDLVREWCRFALTGSRVNCEFDVPEDLWPANIDREQIRQVVINIVTNAREAMPGGGLLRVSAQNVAVHDSATPPLSPGRYVKLTFRDEGKGIAREDLRRVFDPYFSTKPRGAKKGTGIGLAVCHSVIEKHGGCIDLASEPGEGATVSLFLPAHVESTTAA